MQSLAVFPILALMILGGGLMASGHGFIGGILVLLGLLIVGALNPRIADIDPIEGFYAILFAFILFAGAIIGVVELFQAIF